MWCVIYQEHLQRVLGMCTAPPSSRVAPNQTMPKGKLLAMLLTAEFAFQENRGPGKATRAPKDMLSSADHPTPGQAHTVPLLWAQQYHLVSGSGPWLAWQRHVDVPTAPPQSLVGASQHLDIFRSFQYTWPAAATYTQTNSVRQHCQVLTQANSTCQHIKDDK